MDNIVKRLRVLRKEKKEKKRNYNPRRNGGIKAQEKGRIVVNARDNTRRNLVTRLP
jgi:hypothetical protein